MLGKNEILSAVCSNKIKISNFNEKNLNSISYDMVIDNKIKCYEQKHVNFVDRLTGFILKKDNVLDSHCENNEYNIIDLSDYENGYILYPENLYLATTKDSVWSDTYIPCISGRSTYARLGIQVHQTAFFANLGHEFKWVLEISVTVPVRIYAGVKLSQMYFEPIEGEITDDMIYHGKYEKENNRAGIPDEK